MPQMTALQPPLPEPKERAEVGGGHEYRRYLLVFAVGVVPMALLINLHVLFLWNTGEIQPYDRIVRNQIAQDAMYLTSFATSYFSYKMALAQAVKPEVVVLGTSRAMQFRGDQFKTTFTNAAGSARNWTIAQEFMNELSVVHKPKIAIIALEYNWFREDFWPHESEKDNPIRLTQFKLREPFRWIRDGKLSLTQYLSLAIGLISETSSGRKGLGAQALIQDRGFSRDGHYRYGAYDLSTSNPQVDTRFHQTLSYLQSGEKTFLFGRHIVKQNWELFERFVRFCKESRISLVTYFPPLAHPLYESLLKINDRRTFVNELRAKLQAVEGIEFYDFSDGLALGDSDCEFYNGTHPGDVDYDRILLAIQAKTPSSKLVPFLNKEKLAENTRLYRGRAVAESGFVESDFLSLGCEKQLANTHASAL